MENKSPIKCQSLSLDFANLPDKGKIPRTRTLIHKPISRVVVFFEDGTKSDFVVPNPGQGFYRERYSYIAAENETKETRRLICHELFWTKVEKEPIVKERTTN